MRFRAHDLYVLLGGKLPYTVGIDLERHDAWTLFHGNRVVGCAGTMVMWRGRHLAWAYFNRDSGGHMVAVTRHTLAKLSLLRGRVEMTVQKDFVMGQKWARMLGFEIETPLLRAYGPDGEDHVGYVKFQE